MDFSNFINWFLFSTSISVKKRQFIFYRFNKKKQQWINWLKKFKYILCSDWSVSWSMIPNVWGCSARTSHMVIFLSFLLFNYLFSSFADEIEQQLCPVGFHHPSQVPCVSTVNNNLQISVGTEPNVRDPIVLQIRIVNISLETR